MLFFVMHSIFLTSLNRVYPVNLYFIHIKINKEYFYNGGIDLKKLYIVIIGLVICAIGIVVFLNLK